MQLIDPENMDARRMMMREQKRDIDAQMFRQSVNAYITSLKSVSPAASLYLQRRKIMEWAAQWEKDNPEPQIQSVTAPPNMFQQ